MNITPADTTIGYQFRDKELLKEATLAAGASVSDPNIEGANQGNKRLALIGDALIRLVIVDQSYANGACTEVSSKAVGDLGSNRSLEKDARKLELDKSVTKNPCQREEVPRTTLASTMEGLVGAVWLDSSRDFEQVRAVIERSGITGERKDLAKNNRIEAV